MQVLVTGATGAVGPAIVAELLRCAQVERVVVLLRPDLQTSNGDRLSWLRLRVGNDFADSPADVAARDRLESIVGDVRLKSVPRGISHIVHAAAVTRLQATLEELRETNVEGTRHLLQLAQSLPDFRQFVQVSTHCVAGQTTGAVPEALRDEPPEFVNRYERSKWEAERVVATAGVPARIVRLTTCLGDESGGVHRAGGVHLALDWLHRGLIPLLPGTPETPVDLISNQAAARVIAKAVGTPVSGIDVCQVAAGAAAPRLRELLDFVVEIFRRRSGPWRRGQISQPSIVGSVTFDEFRRSVRSSRDALFLQILDAVDTLLTPLLYPRTYETTRAETLWGGPLPIVDWRQLVSKVLEHRIAKTTNEIAAHA